MTDAQGSDWVRWHAPYDDPASSLSRRLARVRFRLTQALDARPPGPIRVLSMCAGQGRDLVEPLARHPRRGDVRALLVEREPANAAVAVDAARRAGLDGAVQVVVGDASTTGAYGAIVPADIALVCGVFGNISDRDIHNTVQQLPGLLAAGGVVIWTRHREPPDLTPTIREWFVREGFREVGFDTEDGYAYAVGTNVLAAPPHTFRPGVSLFRFVGDGGDAVR